MKLLIVIVNQRDLRRLREALIERDYRFTELGSTGGFLRQGNATFLIGVPDDQVPPLLELIAAECRTREEALVAPSAESRVYADPVGQATTVIVGGAQVFVVAVEQAVRV